MRIKRKNGLKIAAITIALLLCLALAVGITGALYQAKRQATGTLSIDQGIIIDYKGFDKIPDEGIWSRENKTTFLLFNETNAQPGEQIAVNTAGIRANEKSVNFYARVKLSYKFYNGETPVELADATKLIKTSSSFWANSWVDGGSTDGYYYYATGSTLNKFEKGAAATTFVDLFATDAKFVIEGAGFTGADNNGESGGFKIDETTSINKIEVYLTLETLQGDATAEQAKALGWKISSEVNFAKVDEGKIVKSNTTEVVTDEQLNVTINGNQTKLEEVKFPYDEEVTLKFDTRNVDYITLKYSTGAEETFGEKAEDFTNDYLSETALKVNAKSSKGSVTGYVVGLWDSEYNDFLFTDKYSILDISGQTAGEYIIENGIAVSGYLGTDSSITIPSKASVRNRDFKIVLEYDGKEEEYAGEGGLYGPQLSELRIKIMSILGGLCFPCNITDKTGKIKETINSLEEFLNWITPVIITGDVNSVKEFWAKYPETMTISYSAIVKASGVFAKEKNILEIAPMAFQRNEYVTDVVISEGITKIGVLAFAADYLDGIKSITLPASLEIIDGCAFADCSFTNIVLPSSLIKMGKRVFDSCEKLETVTINSNIVVPFEVDTENNCEFFNRCNKLTAIYVPADLVDAYKADANWSMYADKIQAIA